jgi:hypothetical protein
MDNMAKLENPIRFFEERQPLRTWDWLLLLLPPLASYVFGAAWYLLNYLFLGGIGVIFSILTSSLCAIAAVRICKNLARSSIAMLAVLYALELLVVFSCVPVLWFILSHLDFGFGPG